MRIAIVSANLGAYESHQAPWPDLVVPDGCVLEIHRLNDVNFPPRNLAMTSRLQCGIPKWDGIAFAPQADVILWIDASCVPTPGAVPWFLGQLGDRDIAVFQHPERRSIKAEAEFMLTRMARPGEHYLNSRYKGEWVREQYEHIAADPLYRDNRLYASTAFAYRPTEHIRAAFWDVWAAKARWLLHDQLYFPYALWRHGCRVSVIADSYLHCEALTFARTR